MTDLVLMLEECRDLLPENARLLDEDEDEADTALRIIAAMAVVVMVMVGEPHKTLVRLRGVAAAFTKLADEVDGAPAQK